MHHGRSSLWAKNCTFECVVAKGEFESTEIRGDKAAQHRRHGVQRYNEINAHVDSIATKNATVCKSTMRLMPMLNLLPQKPAPGSEGACNTKSADSGSPLVP